ncbi:MAG: hypothetical protein WKF37_17805 [Bryobacteraceae bacterium]
MRIALRALLPGLFLCGYVHADSVLLLDNFSVPGPALDLTRWTTEMGMSSFLGRTQSTDWVRQRPGGVASGPNGAQLALHLQPDGIFLLGTQAKSIASFQPQASEIRYTAGCNLRRCRLTSSTASIFTGAARAAGAQQHRYRADHKSAGGMGMQVLTNVFPNSSGSGAPGMGQYQFFVYAKDNSGTSTLLGSRFIYVDNIVRGKTVRHS